MNCKVEKTKNANEVKLEITIEAEKFEKPEAEKTEKTEEKPAKKVNSLQSLLDNAKKFKK